MTSFRLKQIGLALCLMVSLLIGYASACWCSHHEEKPKASETSCHGPYQEPNENVETTGTGNAVDVDCVCFANLRSPYIVSKSAKKELKSNDAISNPRQLVIDVEPAVTGTNSPVPEMERDLAYSNVLESLLPARAPPRL